MGKQGGKKPNKNNYPCPFISYEAKESRSREEDECEEKRRRKNKASSSRTINDENEVQRVGDNVSDDGTGSSQSDMDSNSSSSSSSSTSSSSSSSSEDEKEDVDGMTSKGDMIMKNAEGAPSPSPPSSPSTEAVVLFEDENSFDFDSLPVQAEGEPPFPASKGTCWECATVKYVPHRKLRGEKIIIHKSQQPTFKVLDPTEYLEVPIWKEEQQRKKFVPSGLLWKEQYEENFGVKDKLLHKVRLLRQLYPIYARILPGMSYTNKDPPHKLVSLGCYTKGVDLWVNFDPQNWQEKVKQLSFSDFFTEQSGASSSTGKSKGKSQVTNSKTLKVELNRFDGNDKWRKVQKLADSRIKEVEKKKKKKKKKKKDKRPSKEKDDDTDDHYSLDSFCVADDEPEPPRIKNKRKAEQMNKNSGLSKKMKEKENSDNETRAKSKSQITPSVSSDTTSKNSSACKRKIFSSDDDDDEQKEASPNDATKAVETSTAPTTKLLNPIAKSGKQEASTSKTRMDVEVQIVKEISAPKMIEEILGQTEMVQSVLKFETPKLLYKLAPKSIQLPDNPICLKPLFKAYFPSSWETLITPLLPLYRSTSNIDQKQLAQLISNDKDEKVVKVGSLSIHPFFLKECNREKVIIVQKRGKSVAWIILDVEELHQLSGALVSVEHRLARNAVVRKYDELIGEVDVSLMTQSVSLEHFKEQMNISSEHGQSRLIREQELQELQKGMEQTMKDKTDFQEKKALCLSIVELNSGENPNSTVVMADGIVVHRIK